MNRCTCRSKRITIEIEECPINHYIVYTARCTKCGETGPVERYEIDAIEGWNLMTEEDE
jgi:hypothetical protein